MLAAITSRHPSALREGATLGLVVATATWIWVAAVDAAAGDPFHTFEVLGGVLAFTVAHYLLNVLYGIVIVAGVHGASREPTLMMALVFGFLMIEFGFAFLTAVFSVLGLGDLAWLRIFVGSLVGALAAVTFLSRRHPLVDRLRQAR
jgi:hypothetical protein